MTDLLIEKIKKLRSKTNVSLIECKEALVKTDGDIDEAIIFLRTKGILKAQNKNLRKTTCGLISVLTDNKEKKSIILEINCETDFVSKTEEFVKYANKLTEFLLYEFENKDGEILHEELCANKKLNDERLSFISKIGENIYIKRVRFIKGNNLFFGYTHGGDFNTGKIGTILSLNENFENDENIIKDLAMQIIATKPLYLKKENIPEEVLLKEKKIYLTTAKEKYADKEKEIITKIIEKQLEDFIKENTLLEQNFIKNQTIKIKDMIKNKIELIDFVRFEVGEIN